MLPRECFGRQLNDDTREHLPFRIIKGHGKSFDVHQVSYLVHFAQNYWRDPSAKELLGFETLQEEFSGWCLGILIKRAVLLVEILSQVL